MTNEIEPHIRVIAEHIRAVNPGKEDKSFMYFVPDARAALAGLEASGLKIITAEDVVTTTGCIQFDLGVCDAGRLRKLEERIAELEGKLDSANRQIETITNNAISALGGCGIDRHKSVVTFGEFVSAGGTECSICLKERIAELDAALAPFAAIPETILSEHPETEELTAAHYWVVIGTPSRTSFTREDLRRAKTAVRITDDKDDDMQEMLEF